MARYDRRMLVPYLQDVYAVELLLRRVQKEASAAQGAVHTYQKRYDSDKKPEEPVGGGLAAMLICAVLGLIAVPFALYLIYFTGSALILAGIALGFVAGCLFYASYLALERYCSYRKEVKKYKNDLKEYEARKGNRDQNKSMITTWSKALETRKKRVTEVRQLRDTIYNANVIPMPYRNIYAVSFLYDYFRTSQADDVDMILQTFVLEEIKAKLDVIIEQQAEMIINQRATIANQEKMEESIARNHEKEMRRLANLNENAERRNQYLEMINTNLVVSNFFAYHDYIKS